MLAKFEWQLAMRVTASAYKRQIGVIATPDPGTGKKQTSIANKHTTHDKAVHAPDRRYELRQRLFEVMRTVCA